jgi:hypothetical protein
VTTLSSNIIPLQMPPKTRISQRNRAQVKATPEPSAQLVTITVDASDPQTLKADTEKLTTKRVHADDNMGNDTEPEGAPAKKKTKVNNAAPKTKVKQVPDTRPGRKGRNSHPGEITKPRIKRTTAQVEADNTAKAEVKRRLEELEEEKKKLYAQMEIDEDEKELERQVKAIRRLSDVVKTDENATESEGEDFNMDVEASDSKDVDTDLKAAGKKKAVSHHT